MIEDPAAGASGGADGQLADELRAIAEALVHHDPPPDDLAEALALARDLRARLTGPRRHRWYDSGSAGTDDSAAAFFRTSPIQGWMNPLAPPLRLSTVTLPDGDPGVEGRVRMGRAYEGPPNGVHGGYVSALFDEVLGLAQHLGSAPGMTARLTVRYRAVTPVEEELVLRAWPEEVRGGRTTVRGTCHAGDVLTAEADGLFVSVDFEAVRAASDRGS